MKKKTTKTATRAGRPSKATAAGSTASANQKAAAPWTRFMDMHSGGSQKLKWGYIFIEAPEAEAKVIFQNRFGHNPNRVTCTCCGDDYSTDESVSLEQATGYDRNCACLVTPRDKRGLYKPPDDPWFKAHYYLEPEDVAEAERRGYEVDTRWRLRSEHVTLKKYLENPDVLVIRAADIKPSERIRSLRDEGYVWQD